ncbi:MAG: hypothetical protein AABX47_07955 [Nanoarchaeota archaeon]
MGKHKHIDSINRLFEKSPVVDFRTIERIVESKDKSGRTGRYAKLLVSNLLRQGKIKKLAKGCYTRHDDNSLAVFCFKPAYLGLQSALSAHNLWEQETIPIIISAKKARSGVRDVMGGNVLVRRTGSERIFGYELMQEGDFYLPYSDIEKTLIDMIVFRQRIDPETMKRINRRIDPRRLTEYLKRYPPRIRKMVMEYRG